MQLLDIGYFLPTIEETFGPGTIAVKDTLSGQSITNWYDKHDLTGDGDGDPVGWFYYLLKRKISAAIGNKNIRDVFFIWMQGETDGLYPNRYSEFYKDNLIGLIKLIESDLRRNFNSEIKFNFVIGRINEFGRKFPDKVAQWDAIREAQVRVAENYPNGTWVNTDDLGTIDNGLHPNGTWVNTDDLGTIDNGLHFDDAGYRLLGERFARAAISLIDP
jgi:lysophospholipase L1-like esterase